MASILKRKLCTHENALDMPCQSVMLIKKKKCLYLIARGALTGGQDGRLPRAEILRGRYNSF